MTIYVDNAHLYLKCSLNVPTSHLFADTPEELHEMAKRIGLDRSAFQGDPGCYDVNATERADAIRLGAKEVTKDEAFKLLQSLKEAKKRSLKEARHARGTAAKNSRAEWLMGERITRALALTAFLIASGMTYKAHAQGAGDPA